jgi:MerR family copper efflux transcriptional regulator
MAGLTVNEAGRRTGWSARMLRYLEQARLVVPERSPAGYRLYGPAELRRLRGLRELRARFGVGLGDVTFAFRLRREPPLRIAVERWLAEAERADWLRWEQRKHERLLAA